MKEMGRLITLLLIFPPLVFGNSFALNHEEATNILKELAQAEFKILEIRDAPLENFWEVVVEARQGKVIFYIHKNLRYILQGQILDRQAKRNLTLDRIKDFRRINPSSLSLENAIPMGEGKRKLFVFTDPQCYFCFQLHEEIKQIKDLQSFFFLYPLTLTSYEKAKSIWCSQDKVKSLEEAYQGKEVRSPSCDTSPIDRNMEFGRGMLIDSTPTLLFQNGKIMEGYPSPKSLEDLLKSDSGL